MKIDLFLGIMYVLILHICHKKHPVYMYVYIVVFTHLPKYRPKKVSKQELYTFVIIKYLLTNEYNS